MKGCRLFCLSLEVLRLRWIRRINEDDRRAIGAHFNAVRKIYSDFDQLTDVVLQTIVAHETT